MKLNDFLQLVGFIFVAKVVFGVFYLLLGWQSSIAGLAIPSWLIVTAVVVDALLAVAAFHFVKK